VPESLPGTGSCPGPAVQEPEVPAAPLPAVEPGPPPPEALRSFPMLQSLPLEALSGLARALRPIRHAAGERILVQGERAERMHFLRSGRVRVEVLTAGEVRVAVAALGPGDCFGEMSLLTGEQASADVLAEEDSESLGLDRSAFNALAAENPGLLRDFTTLVSRRLRSADEAFATSRIKERGVTQFLREDAGGALAAFVGKDRATRDLEKRIGALAATDAPILILGERGTGKEHVARRIHYGGPRRDLPILAVECDRVTATQWGDSLFGDYHRKDGRPHPRGVCYMDLVEGGTLLLKNVEMLPPAVLERLSRYLQKEGIGGRRRDVRILATHRGTPGGNGGPGGILKGLPPELAREIVTIPPLRERKRDIPDLARHFLEKHAERLGLGPRRIDDQAMVKLVTHDYEQGNVAELEEALRRALLLSGDDVIDAEEIFLHRPGESRERPGILRVPRPLVRLALRAWPGVLRGAVAFVFAALVLLCFVTPATAAGQAALLLVWSAWWPALALSFLFLGRAWCSLCPMAFAGSFAQRYAEGRRQVPAWLRDREPLLLAAGFFLILWAEEVADMRHSPIATGILLLAILAGAVITSLRYPRRTWCRHLCPLGGLAGACATTSMVQVRSTPDICEAKCTGHSCYRGDEKVPGCPMFHHVMFLDTNRDCVLCLDCVRACPNGSPRVIVTLPAQELWHDLRSRPEVGWFATLLQGLLVALALAAYGERVHAEPFAAWIQDHRLLTLTALFAAFSVLPPALLRLHLPRGAGSDGLVEKARAWTRLTAWLPLLATGFAAYQAAFLPGMSGLETRVGFSPDTGDARTVLSSPVLPLFQVVLLAAGLVLSLVVLQRQHPSGEPGRQVRAVLDTAMGMAGVALWFVLLTGLLVGATTAAAFGPWAVALVFVLVGVSYRLTLGLRPR